MSMKKVKNGRVKKAKAKEKGKAGRPSALNDLITTQAEEYLRAGTPQRFVAKYLGIDEKTWYNWVNRGREDWRLKKDTVYARFFQRSEKAIAEAVIRNVAQIQKDDSWQSKAWFLERRYPEEFGKRNQMEVSTADGTTIILKSLADKPKEENIFDDG